MNRLYDRVMFVGPDCSPDLLSHKGTITGCFTLTKQVIVTLDVTTERGNTFVVTDTARLKSEGCTFAVGARVQIAACPENSCQDWHVQGTVAANAETCKALAERATIADDHVIVDLDTPKSVRALFNVRYLEALA